MGNAWVQLQRARLLELQDRVEEALEVAEVASGLHPQPWYRVGVQTRAHLLQLLDRDEDAIQLLREADGHLQNGPVAGQLYTLLAENGRWKEAVSSLERLVELSPLMEKPLKEWVTAQRARTGYHLGKRAEAARLAAELERRISPKFRESAGESAGSS